MVRGDSPVRLDHAAGVRSAVRAGAMGAAMNITTCARCGRVHNGEGCDAALVTQAARDRLNADLAAGMPDSASLNRLEAASIRNRIGTGVRRRVVLVLEGPGDEYKRTSALVARVEQFAGTFCVVTKQGARFSLVSGWGLSERAGWRLATADERDAFRRGQR